MVNRLVFILCRCIVLLPLLSARQHPTYDLLRPTGFLQCFDTVGLVIWPVKIVPDMTYNVLSGTLNPTHSLAKYFSESKFNLCCCWCFDPVDWVTGRVRGM